MENGHFVISLDFELLWGVFDKVEPAKKSQYFMQTKETIPKILTVFKENDIHCTWAVVGMLFNSNWDEWESNIPKNLPKYDDGHLSAYQFGDAFKKVENSANFCFSPGIIKKIADTPYQEIGTHTYSHYYCQETGQTLKSFKADMEKAISLAKKGGLELRSLVFPRNQFKPEYLKICKDMGINNVRSNPVSWYWKNPNATGLKTKLARTGDAYLPFGKKSYSLAEIIKTEGFPIEQKASRFYRPVESNSLLRKLKLKRIFKEMEMTAKNNEIYHLWWHPHNFGDMPEESLMDLKHLLNHYKMLNKKYNFQSANMMEIGEMV